MQGNSGVPGRRGLLGDPERSEGSSSNPSVSPDAEVLATARRRRFTAEYKLRIVEKADACSQPGELGRLLRREGLYSSQLAAWRKQREQGALAGLSKKRGRRSTKSPLREECVALRRRVEQLERKLEKAETIIEFQKKLASILEEPRSDLDGTT